MVHLRVRRPYQYVDSRRDYSLVIDGPPAARIRPDEAIDLFISPGAHSLIARVDWCSGNELHLACDEGQRVVLEVGSRVVGWRILMALLCVSVLRSQYICLRRLYEADSARMTELRFVEWGVSSQ